MEEEMQACHIIITLLTTSPTKNVPMRAFFPQHAREQIVIND
jgi:hypothetical protein